MTFNKLLLPIAGIFMLAAACTAPTKDVSLHFAPKAYNYLMELEMYDLSMPDELYSGDVQIEVNGPDAHKIYNVDGTKNFEANFGRLMLITDAAGEPTAGNPLDFTVKVSASNYKDNEIQFVVSQGQNYVSYNAFLINRSNLPNGLVASSTSASLDNNGSLSQPFQFTANAAGNSEALSLTIPSGVSFKDQNGATLNGSNLNIEVIGHDDEASNVNLALPNEGLFSYEENGESVVSILSPEGCFEIEMDVDGSTVKQFSGAGVELRMPLPTSITNVAANRPYQAGDQVRLLSFSQGNTNWQQEGDYTVVEESGKLWIKPNITHLSYYTIATIPTNNNYNAFTIKLINTVGNVSLIEKSYIGYTISQNQNVFYGYSMSRFLARMTDESVADLIGQTITVRHDHPSLRIYVQLCQTCSRPRDTDPALIEVTASGSHADIEYKPVLKSINVGYQLKCEGEEVTYQPFFGSKVYARLSGSSDTYQELYTFTLDNAANKLHKIYGLENGMTYDFKLSWFSLELFQTSLTVKNGEIHQLELTDSECSSIGF